MPKRPDRTREVEEQVAALIARLRKRNDWSYGQLADRMTAAGCEMYPAGIQRTEKAERRITVEELVAYARVFETPVESLIFAEAGELRTKEYWRDLLAAERMQEILRTARRSYEELVHGVHLELKRNPELRQSIVRRRDGQISLVERQARELARRDGEDVSTPELFLTYVREWFSTPGLAACDAVLEENRS